jgi:stalled ribosome alternative rescue factor ArfA
VVCEAKTNFSESGNATVEVVVSQFCSVMAKKRITKKELLQIEQAAVREERKEQGALDGRFREKVEKSKKSYTRTTKHKKKGP